MSDSYPKPADLPLDQEDWDALPEHVQRIPVVSGALAG